MNEEARLTSPSLSADTPLVITVPAAQASWEFFGYTRLLPDSGFARAFPCQKYSSPNSSKAGSFWIPICLNAPSSKRPSLFVLPQCHGAPTPHGPSLASSVSLHPVNFLHITAKFPMIRWHCTIIFKSQFKITGIFSFPKRAQTPQKQR